MEHEHHRNVLYALCFIMLILQVASFVSLSSQTSRVSAELSHTQAQLKNATEQYNDLRETDIANNQRNFNELSAHVGTIESEVSQQKSSFSQEIKLLKSTQGDFSEVVAQSVKSVVTVRTDSALGTGFFVHSGGYIVTNYHVIDGAKTLSVVTHDRSGIQAELVGSDPFHDVAILKISQDYPVLEFADSDALQVGNKVIAIGNPLGLSFTVTEGIISAVDRVGPTSLAEYIQTDVSLNPGNSGGPLIDGSGKVVGMNNFKASDAENIGFALEANVLKGVIKSASNGAAG